MRVLSWLALLLGASLCGWSAIAALCLTAAHLIGAIQ